MKILKKVKKTGGFTLIELLVVVAILIILLSIMIPSVGRAKQLAKAVVCISNLREICKASHSFTVEHNTLFPKAYYMGDENGNPTTDAPKTFACWDTISDFSGNTRPGVIWGYIGGTGGIKVQQCPSFEGNSNTPSDQYTGYNYNTSYIGKGDFERPSKPASTTRVKNSAQTALFGDGEYAAGANKYMRAPWGNRNYGDSTFNGRVAGTQGYRHLGKTHVGWVDGHVTRESGAFLESKESGNISMVGENNGWLSKDDSLYDLE